MPSTQAIRALKGIGEMEMEMEMEMEVEMEMEMEEKSSEEKGWKG